MQTAAFQELAPSASSPAHPEDGGGVSSWNFRKPSHLDAAVCPGKFNWILLLAKASRSTSYSSLLNHSNNIWWEVQIIKLIVI
jgi:hypothetical protein